MKKIYQTIVSQENGNCMQAAIASLFDLELDEVPNFIQLQIDDPGKNANLEEMLFIQERGYEYCCYFPSMSYDKKPTEEQIERTLKILDADNGVNGYFYASVPSKTFPDGSHAVIIDKYMNVVHDPNPNQLALTWTKYDIQYIVTNSDNWSIDENGELIIKSLQDKFMNMYESMEEKWKTFDEEILTIDKLEKAISEVYKPREPKMVLSTGLGGAKNYLRSVYKSLGQEFDEEKFANMKEGCYMIT